MKCTKCEIDKEDSDFTKRKSGSLYAWCKICHAKHKKETREKNLKRSNERVQELRAIKRKERQEYVFNYLLNHPCVKCGEADPVVLEFDHRDPTTKAYNISNLVSYALSFETLTTELNKCDVLCANCHRRKTASQFNSFKIELVNKLSSPNEDGTSLRTKNNVGLIPSESTTPLKHC